jgi:subtilisin family serine protease
MQGKNGLTMAKGSGQIDPFNNNKFFGVSGEGLTGNAFSLSFAYANLFYGCRTAEAVAGYAVQEDNTCLYNRYDFSHANLDTKLNINGRFTSYNGPIVGAEGVPYIRRFYTDTNFKKHLESFSPTYQYVANKNVTLTLTDSVVNCQSDTSAVSITIPAEFEYEGKEFYFCTAWKVEAINFLNALGVEVLSASKFSSGKTYKIGYYSGAWRSMEISGTVFMAN